MGLRITTNVAAINAIRHLRLSTHRVGRSMERLSSGLRINRAGDDPAGLAVAQRMRMRIRGLQVSHRNALDGLSLTSVAEGSLAEVSNMVIRMRELAMQASSDTLSESQRDYLQLEFAELRDEIDRITGITQFNGIRPFSGDAGTLELHVAPGADPSASIDLDLTESLDANVLGLDVVSIDGPDGSNARQALATLEAASYAVSSWRAGLGATQSRLESTIRSIGNQIENFSAAESRIRDVDIALEMTELVSAQILQQAGIAVLGQALNTPNLVLQLLQSVGRRR